MTTGNVSISGNVQGAPTGSRTFGPFTIPLNAAVDATTLVALINGNTSVSVPSGATVAVISGPNVSTGVSTTTTYAGTLTLKGVNGDTGIAINASYWLVLPLASSVTTFVLSSTASGTCEVWFA